MKTFDIQMSGHEKRYRSEEIAPVLSPALPIPDVEEKEEDKNNKEDNNINNNEEEEDKDNEDKGFLTILGELVLDLVTRHPH